MGVVSKAQKQKIRKDKREEGATHSETRLANGREAANRKDEETKDV